MLDVQEKPNDVHVVSTLELLQRILKGYRPRNFAIKLWDGTLWQQEAGQLPRFTFVLNHAAALRKMFFPATECRLGEAYMFEDFEIEGDIIEALHLARYLWETWHWTDTIHYMPQLLRLPKQVPVDGAYQAKLSGRQHSLERDRKAIQYHYDVSNEFYQLWLDKNMVYSCAYFESPNEDVDTAQEHKLDYICRKLRLKADERLLDIGCGWGALITYAAKHYGVQTMGVTLSENQAEYAQKRIKEMNLSEQSG